MHVFPLPDAILIRHATAVSLRPVWRNRAKMDTIRARPFLIDIAPSAHELADPVTINLN